MSPQTASLVVHFLHALGAGVVGVPDRRYAHASCGAARCGVQHGTGSGAAPAWTDCREAVSNVENECGGSSAVRRDARLFPVGHALLAPERAQGPRPSSGGFSRRNCGPGVDNVAASCGEAGQRLAGLLVHLSVRSRHCIPGASTRAGRRAIGGRIETFQQDVWLGLVGFTTAHIDSENDDRKTTGGS